MFTPTTIEQPVIDKLVTYFPNPKDIHNDILWKNFVNTWNRLMALLCWNDTSTKSLLEGTVKFSYVNEIYENPTQIVLAHNKIKEVTSVKVRTFDGGGFNEFSIANPNNFLIPNTGLYNLFFNNVQLGVCRGREVQVELDYVAGYAQIPEELFTAIADIIFYGAGVGGCNKDDSEGAKQCVGNKPAMNAYLKSKSIPDYSWTWEIPNHIVQDVMDTMSSKGLLAIIFENYSNCISRLDFKGSVIHV